MNHKDILRLSKTFYKIASDLEGDRPSLTASNLVRNLVDKGHRMVGYGGGRIVFDMGDGSVIKIARNHAGIDQNKSEVEVYKNAGNYRNMLSPVLDYDKKEYLWVKFPNIDVLKNESEFEHKAGFLYEDLEEMTYGKDALRVLFRSGEISKETFEKLNRIFELSKFIGTHPAEFAVPSHWGLYNGNLVLVDYGKENHNPKNPRHKKYYTSFSKQIYNLDPDPDFNEKEEYIESFEEDFDDLDYE